MTKVKILIEIKQDAMVEKASGFDFTASDDGKKTMMKSKTVSTADDISGLTIDTEFGVTAVTDIVYKRGPHGFASGADEAYASDYGQDGGAGGESPFSPADFDAQPAIETGYLMRAECDSKDAEKIAEDLMKMESVVGVYADVAIEPCLICPGSPPLGDDRTVERLLCVDALQRAGADGQGVLVAIVDTGINMAHLHSKGKNPTFDAARSWTPRAGLTPGSMPVGHGTMCAFDACIAAPKCTLLDIALLQSTATGGTRMEGFLSDAVRAYQHLVGIMRAPRRPGETRSLVVNNSWGMFHPSWDYPVGHSGNYSNNPNHPFNRMVGTLASHGADILFAAGNCGSDCPDGRCQGVTANAIYGANSHAEVLSVAGVDTTKTRVGYSSKGPGRLVRNKPDISGYTHFLGSGVYAADGGTSAACPVVAGVVASIRTKRPFVAGNPSRSPAAIRTMVTSSAEDLGEAGYDFAHGYGVVNGCAIARRLRPIVIDICRIRPHLCGPIPLPPEFCRRFPGLCRPRPFPLPPFPPRPLPIPPRPGQDAEFGYDQVSGNSSSEWQPASMAMLDLGDGSALNDMSVDDLADLFYYIGHYQALAGVAHATTPSAVHTKAGGSGCNCSN